MTSNPQVNLTADLFVPKYATHWHLRITDPTPNAAEILKTTMGELLNSNYLTYALLTESKEGDGRQHYHAAIGTFKSIKTETLKRKLKMLKLVDIKAICHCYYLSPVYNESTPEGNWNYVKEGHTVLFEAGMLGEDKNKFVKNISLHF